MIFALFVFGVFSSYLLFFQIQHLNFKGLFKFKKTQQDKTTQTYPLISQTKIQIQKEKEKQTKIKTETKIDYIEKLVQNEYEILF